MNKMKKTKKHSIHGPTVIPGKRLMKWEDLMRKFTKAHQEECKTLPLDVPKSTNIKKTFSTGAKYEGHWDATGMSGHGEYKFPNGVTYSGDFEDGMFCGKGELQYSGGAVIRGKWKKGYMIDKTLLFSDSLEYKEEYWKYCTMPDRRFAIEYDIDIKPAGKSYLTADQPTKEIPPGYYDTCDGFYDPQTNAVYKYEDLTAILRSPSTREQKWITDNCRTSPEEPLGPRPDLYEKWSEPMLDLPPTPAPAAGVKSTVTSFKTQSIFDADLEFNFSDSQTNFYDTIRRSSNIGRYRSLLS